MPKSITIDPYEVRAKNTVTVDPIPINRYVSDPKVERERYGRDTLRALLRDMITIRTFESMLDSIKKNGSYEGIEYEHKGPAHLSIGQESSAVGQCVHLDPDDFIFGSHRSHGEILAKCFSAIRKLDESRLGEIMESYADGETLRVAERGFDGPVTELARRFTLYGALAEIFARRPGFNRGLGGSMHTFFAPFGSLPNNAVVGGSSDIAVGSALYKRINRKPGIVIANIGDAASGCGPTWEAMMLAAMDQYHTLWDSEIGGAPPVMFNFMNNFYGMGGQTAGETMGFGVLARIGAGVNPQNMHAERVDGYNPLAVAEAVARKKDVLLSGQGPVLLDTMTYRYSGHSPSDASSYRTPEEVKLWEQEDPIENYARYLQDNKVLSEGDVEELKEEAGRNVLEVLRLAIDDSLSPRVEGSFIESVMFSNKERQRMAEGEPEVRLPWDENPRIKSLSRRSRFWLDDEGKELPKTRVYTLRDGVFEAILHRFYTDPTMVAYGEENRDWGGAFGVYRGLTESLPYHRLFNSSISEGAIVGSGVGYALSGGRAVVELMYCDFMGRAGDEIFNQMAKWQAMSAGELEMPLVLRVSVGNKYGAQHSQDWTALVAHIPGLKVMFPSTPYDAKGMMNLALAGTDPVVFFESQRIYDMPEKFVEGGVPEGYYEVPEGLPVIRRSGSDLTILAIGAATYRALDAAAELSKQYGLEAEVIDLRFMNPLEYGPILESLNRTGNVVLVSDACERGSFLHTVASNITTAAFDALDAPPAVVGSRNWITPAAEMEETFFPQPEWIIDTVHERILPLPGHRPTTTATADEQLRRNRFGV
ncbi:MAG: thiamine pyrophosphate-dependent enzyme [Spirochaetaceae bacterium]